MSGLRFLKWSLTNGQAPEVDVLRMITAAQLRAARALLGIDQRKLAELAGLSVPTIQRMEASDGVIRGNVESLTKLVTALNAAGVELVCERAATQGTGRGVRLFK
jgi:transcriptional regulator with XRE-family HTH domain